MIVRDIMQTQLITVEFDDTLCHAALLLRQYQFHHLPVVQHRRPPATQQEHYTCPMPALIFQGLLTSQDIDMAVALAEQERASNPLARSWQERRVAEMMHTSPVSLTPRTPVAVAAQLLVERGIDCLPVIESDQTTSGASDVLVGIVTRSDILLALARALGGFEPGTQVTLQLPHGQMTPLAKALLVADELHIGVCSVLAAPLEQNISQHVSLRLRTINPAPFFMHLEREGVSYTVGDGLIGEKEHV
jgi:acetoin utilization protein AcuB